MVTVRDDSDRQHIHNDLLVRRGARILPLYFAVLLLALLGHEIFLRDARFFPQLFRAVLRTMELFSTVAE